MHMIYVTLFTYASSRGMILDVVPRLDASSFIQSIKRSLSRRGCAIYVISDGGIDQNSRISSVSGREEREKSEISANIKKPTKYLSNGGRNLVSIETLEFFSRLGIKSKLNLPLSPWQEEGEQNFLRDW